MPSDSTAASDDVTPRRRRAQPAPPPAWMGHLPLALGVSGAASLIAGAYLGARYGIRRAALDPDARSAAAAARSSAAAGAASTAAAVAGTGAGHFGDAAPTLREALRAAGPPLASLAARAFAYGTLLCFAGASVIVGAAAFILDVRSLQGFTDRLSAHGPRVRSTLEGAASPALTMIADNGRVAARSTQATVGAIVRSATPQIRSSGVAGGVDDDFEGISAKDAAALREFAAWFTGEASDSVATPTPAPAAPARRPGIRVE